MKNGCSRPKSIRAKLAWQHWRFRSGIWHRVGTKHFVGPEPDVEYVFELTIKEMNIRQNLLKVSFFRSPKLHTFAIFPDDSIFFSCQYNFKGIKQTFLTEF